MISAVPFPIEFAPSNISIDEFDSDVPVTTYGGLFTPTAVISGGTTTPSPSESVLVCGVNATCPKVGGKWSRIFLKVSKFKNNCRKMVS